MNDVYKKIAVIIPAYNEEESIASVVNSILNLNIENTIITPIVINDCSTDNTYQIAKNLNCILLNLPVNIGIGGTVQTGYKYAFKHNFDYAIQVDGDGQHPASEIEILYKEIKNSDFNIIIGSRFINKEGFQSTKCRRLGILFLKNWIKLFSGISINDNTSGFRIFDKKAIELAQKIYPDEYPEPESIIFFTRKGLKIKETAVIMNARYGGKSSIDSFKQLYYVIKVSLAIFYSFLKTKK